MDSIRAQFDIYSDCETQSKSQSQETFHPLDIGFFVEIIPCQMKSGIGCTPVCGDQAASSVFPRHKEGSKTRDFQHE